MYIKDLALLDLEDIYNMPNSDLKKFELLKRLLVDETNKLKAEGREKDAEFVKETIKSLVVLQGNSIGHNLD